MNRSQHEIILLKTVIQVIKTYLKRYENKHISKVTKMMMKGIL